MPTDTDTGAAPPSDRVRRRAALLATAVALPLTIVLVLIVVAAERRAESAQEPAPTASASAGALLPPVAVPAPPEPGPAAERSCAELQAALPNRLGDLPARPVDSPSPYVAAWGEPAVTLRCGVARPPTFLASAEVQDINGVTWFPERRGDRTAWIVVDRPVYVEVIVAADEASAPVARLSAPVAAALPRQALDPVR